MNTILVVDESEIFLLIVKSLFDRSGCNVLMAKNATEAFRFIEEEKPQLVLLSQYLPDLKGNDVCRKIKNIEESKDIIVIMMVTASNRSDIDKSVDAGCDDYLIKPVHKEKLLDCVSKYVEILKRKDERVPIYENAKYFHEGVEYSGHIHVLSKGGAFIMGERMVAPDSLIRLKFSISGINESIDVQGKVAWNFDSNKQFPQLLNTAQGMGIQFIEISDDAEKAIGKFISLGNDLRE